MIAHTLHLFPRYFWTKRKQQPFCIFVNFLKLLPYSLNKHAIRRHGLHTRNRAKQFVKVNNIFIPFVKCYYRTLYIAKHFKQKFTLLKPKFTLVDNLGQEIATIKGDWKAWNFEITDAAGQKIGTIDKKWNGMAKELFTTADKYAVNIDPSVTDENTRIAVASVAAAIDMILKEGN